MKHAHHCDPDKPERGPYGRAYSLIFEDAEGHFVISNGEYESQVTYCPDCGAKAPTPPENE